MNYVIYSGWGSRLGYLFVDGAPADQGGAH